MVRDVRVHVGRPPPWGTRPTEGHILITDPGPDPDDVKAILTAAVAHRRGEIRLLAVVANGGGPVEARNRARLARAVLDEFQCNSVPVAVGSDGVDYAPFEYEYAHRGFHAVRDSDLLEGEELITSTLQDSAPKSVTVVCISGLTDMASVCRKQRSLVLSRVRRVVVQGGLTPVQEAGHDQVPYKPDSSTNNTFDMDAASELYGFCFKEGLRLQVPRRAFSAYHAATPTHSLALPNPWSFPCPPIHTCRR